MYHYLTKVKINTPFFRGAEGVIMRANPIGYKQDDDGHVYQYEIQIATEQPGYLVCIHEKDLSPLED